MTRSPESFERYFVFDTETPNAYGDRMSAIGAVIVENGEITQSFSTLVNPETWFAPFNVQLTGIRPEEAARAPVFPEIWQTLAPLMENSILVAHNAPFDMAVLCRCLRAYHIGWKPVVPYLCTCQIGRSRAGKASLPPVADLRLNTLCAALHIPLDHHRAGSDSEACAALLLHYLRAGVPLEPLLRRYDLQAGRTIPSRKPSRKK